MSEQPTLRINQMTLLDISTALFNSDTHVNLALGISTVGRPLVQGGAQVGL